MFLTSFLNTYLNKFLSIYFEAMLFIILLKNCRQSKFKMLFYIYCLQKHSQIVGEAYIVPAIQTCLVCSTLPVEFIEEIEAVWMSCSSRS